MRLLASSFRPCHVRVQVCSRPLCTSCVFSLSWCPPKPSTVPDSRHLLCCVLCRARAELDKITLQRYGPRRDAHFWDLCELLLEHGASMNERMLITIG